MARRVGPKKVQQYSLEFKLKAVKLSQLPSVEVQAVADALEIQPLHVVAVAERKRVMVCCEDAWRRIPSRRAAAAVTSPTERWAQPNDAAACEVTLARICEYLHTMIR